MRERFPTCGLCRAVALYAVLLRRCKIDDGVDAIARYPEFDGEIDVTAAEEVDERVDPLRSEGAQPVRETFAVSDLFRAERA